MKRLDDPFYAVTPARRSGHLEREGGHKIYWEESGDPDGIPTIFCHGGPGGANSPGYRRLSDSTRWRIIQFDQRGCGKSQPFGALEDNSLQATLGDMEALREHLGVDRWVVGGGSFGGTLTIAYGEAYPENCLGLFAGSVWLCREKDMHWWFHGVRTLFPELWEQFAELAPENERHDLRSAYCKMILGDDKELAAEAGKRLYLYEEGFMHFNPPFNPSPGEQRGPAYGRIFAHYAANNFFLEENQLIEQADRIAHLPVELATGRYDCCTPPDNAYDLAKVLPNANLTIIPVAGHYPTEWAAGEGYLQACDRLLQRVKDMGL